jgi:uroporphyrinogen-III decarboxylase
VDPSKKIFHLKRFIFVCPRKTTACIDAGFRFRRSVVKELLTAHAQAVMMLDSRFVGGAAATIATLMLDSGSRFVGPYLEVILTVPGAVAAWMLVHADSIILVTYLCCITRMCHMLGYIFVDVSYIYGAVKI